MEKLEFRARARATARATRHAPTAEYRSGEVGRRSGPMAPQEIDSIDEAQARSACKPMGELEYVIRSADSTGRVRALYVVVPDLSMKMHYERLGFAVDAGCRVLVDASSLRPVAVLRISACGGAMPAKCAATAGYNPYFDIPTA